MDARYVQHCHSISVREESLDSYAGDHAMDFLHTSFDIMQRNAV